MHICDPQLNDARFWRRDRFWRWVCRDLNNRHECWLEPCPSIGHFAVVACYRGVHLPPPREQQAAVDPILPRHLGDIGSLRETLGKDPSLLLRRPTPPAPTTADQLDPTVALPIMLVLMPIMKQRTTPRSRNKGHNRQYVAPQQGGVLMPLSIEELNDANQGLWTRGLLIRRRIA